MGLGKPPRAKHIEHNPRLGRGEGAQPGARRRWGSVKAVALGEGGNRRDQAEQVKPGKLTRKTLTAIMKRNSQRPPWLPEGRERQAETAKLFQMRLNLQHLRGLM